MLELFEPTNRSRPSQRARQPNRSSRQAWERRTPGDSGSSRISSLYTKRRL